MVKTRRIAQRKKPPTPVKEKATPRTPSASTSSTTITGEKASFGPSKTENVSRPFQTPCTLRRTRETALPNSEGFMSDLYYRASHFDPVWHESPREAFQALVAEYQMVRHAFAMHQVMRLKSSYMVNIAKHKSTDEEITPEIQIEDLLASYPEESLKILELDSIGDVDHQGRIGGDAKVASRDRKSTRQVPSGFRQSEIRHLPWLVRIGDDTRFSRLKAKH